MGQSHMYIGGPLSLFAISMSFAYPYLFVKFSARKTIQRMSRALDGTISFILGMAFAHHIAHILPFVNGLVEAANQLQPLSGAIPAAGFLAIHLLHGVSRGVRGRNKPVSYGVEPRTTARSCVTRPLSRATYVSLLATASMYSAVESLVTMVYMLSMEGSLIDTSGDYYCFFFTNQLVLAVTLGVVVLKTCYSLTDMVKADLLFLTATYAGLHVGSTLQGKHMIPSTYTFLAVLSGLSSGAYLKLFVDDVFLPEMIPSRRRKLCHFGLGLVVCLSAIYCTST